MRWIGGRSGGDVEDRRGMGGMVAGGGIGALVIALVAHFVFGVNVNEAQQIGDEVVSGAGQAQHGQVGTPSDEAGKFVDIIAANINDVWIAKIKGYSGPHVVLYERGTATGCGLGQSAMGPFYCPRDATVYLDLVFWRQMESLGGSSAEFARAYVIAHEFGHHVQNLTGGAGQLEGRDSGTSVAIELQADCYAGVWAANASAASGGKVSLEPGDLAQGLRTAKAIGDDAIQRQAGQQVSPENFTHGSSAQRVAALQRGFQAGEPGACQTN